MAKQARMRPSWKKANEIQRCDRLMEFVRKFERNNNKPGTIRFIMTDCGDSRVEYSKSFDYKLLLLKGNKKPFFSYTLFGQRRLITFLNSDRVSKILMWDKSYEDCLDVAPDEQELLDNIIGNQGSDGPSLEHKPLIGDFKLHHAVICATERRPHLWTEGLPQDAKYAIYDFEKKCRDEGKSTSRQKFENGGPLADINLKILDVVKNSNVPYLCYSTETQTFAISCCDKEIRAKCLKLWKEYEANQEDKELAQ